MGLYLTDTEYQACSQNHIAVAATLTPEGKRMSINVEHVGNLMVQHYVEDLAEQSRCRLVSLSDSIGPDIASRVTVVVIWAFAVDAIDSAQRRSPTASRSAQLPAIWKRWRKRGVTFVNASEAAQQALSAHNAEETPLFASITIFEQLYRLGFPIEKIHTVEHDPAADDELSVEDNNTSAFNCRGIPGTNRWSQHAYGRAIDLNLLNPSIDSTGAFQPKNAAAYLDRSRTDPGLEHVSERWPDPTKCLQVAQCATCQRARACASKALEPIASRVSRKTPRSSVSRPEPAFRFK